MDYYHGGFRGSSNMYALPVEGREKTGQKKRDKWMEVKIKKELM